MSLQLETERLILRPLNIHDAEELFNYRSDKITNRHQGWIPETIDSVLDFLVYKIEREINIPGTWFQLAVIHKASSKLIGDIGIHFIIGGEQQVELGFTLDKEYQRQGYAIESVRAVIDYLFNSLNKHRITTSILADNTSSIRLVESLDFRKEAHFKKAFLENGLWLDDTIYAILKEEWCL